jgi:hypothetical protein
MGHWGAIFVALVDTFSDGAARSIGSFAPPSYRTHNKLDLTHTVNSCITYSYRSRLVSYHYLSSAHGEASSFLVGNSNNGEAAISGDHHNNRNAGATTLPVRLQYSVIGFWEKLGHESVTSILRCRAPSECQS